MFNSSAYLARIALAPTCPAPTADALSKLQWAHLQTVPYENLDILEGKPLSLDVDALFDKIVTRHRGGFCFELNELFGQLLRALGYEVTDLFARFLADEPTIPMRRHHVLLVRACDAQVPLLCDVGVGSGSPNLPLLLLEGEIQQQGESSAYRFEQNPFLGWVLMNRKRGEWLPLYSFTEEKQLPVDFVATCFYCEHAPESPFNKEPMIAIRTPTGRLTRDGEEFRTFDGDAVTIERADSREQAERWMLERFGLATQLGTEGAKPI